MAVEPATTALFCCNDRNAVGAIAEIEDQGLQVPQDMSVVGYDNTAPRHRVPAPVESSSAPVEREVPA